MGASTPFLAIPYPTGTDRVADGDNAMQAIAERVEGRMSSGWLAYIERAPGQLAVNTANQVLLTLPALTLPAGRRVRLSARVPYFAGTNGIGEATLMEGATILGRHYQKLTGASTNDAFWVVRILNPTAGAHTYSLNGQGAGGSNVAWSVNSEATNPAWLMVEDLGPAAIT